MKLGGVLGALKAWSNFRLMVLIGSAFTILSLLGGALYVRASTSESQQEPPSAELQAERSLNDSRAGGETGGPSPEPPPATTPAELARAGANPPRANAGQDFQVTCAPVGPITQGSSPPLASCRVTSYNGFTGKVDLSCASVPPGLTCDFSPKSVTPAANEAAPFQLQIGSGQVGVGSYLFDVVGRSGSRVNPYSFPFSISPPVTLPSPPPAPALTQSNPSPAPSASPSPAGDPTFTIACTLQGPESAIDKLLWSLTQGAKGTIKCLVTPLNGFDEEVTLSLANVSDQVVSNFNPPILKLAQGIASFVDLNFDLRGLEKGKEYTFDVTGSSPSKTLVKRVVLTVTE